MSTSYRCPVCHKLLTKLEYQRALGILGERERHLEHEKRDLKKKLKQAKAARTAARKAGIATERARTQRLLQGKAREIQTLKERIEQLKKGSTPQTEGLEFEDQLVARLRREFRNDDVQHKGKAGDVLQYVRLEGKSAGLIVYECKRTPHIQTQHIHQANAAKQSRNADFAVLVTTGSRRGFTGLATIQGVLVVSPLGAVPLASLLRAHLIEMLRSKLSTEQRAQVALDLMAYITSPQFKNPIEEVVHLSRELQGMIHEEASEHFRLWKKRWDRYQRISWNTSLIRSNLELVLHSQPPRPAIPHPVPQLRLAPTTLQGDAPTKPAKL